MGSADMVEAPKHIVHVSWTRIEEQIEHLAQQIRACDWLPTGIIPVAYGGLIPGAMLAYKLGIYDICPVLVKSYCGREQVGITENDIPPRLLETQGEGFLVVDDICDTGCTLQFLKQYLPKACSAVLYTKQSDPTFYAGLGSQDFWYNFPWEDSRHLRRD